MTRDFDPAVDPAGEADDEALSWAGEDDPTLSSSSAVPPVTKLAPGWKVVGEPGTISEGDGSAEAVSAGAPAELSHEQSTGDSSDASDHATSTTDAAAASSAALIVLGILGGIYMLYTVGWAITAGRVQSGTSEVVGSFMFSLGLWLAVAAPALWFGVTVWLTQQSTRWRLFWLVLGVVVLVPVPFVVGAGVGA